MVSSIAIYCLSAFIILFNLTYSGAHSLIFSSITNNSIKHQSFVYRQFKWSKCSVWYDPTKGYHSGLEYTWVQWRRTSPLQGWSQAISFVSYHGYSLGESYSSAEMQPVCSTAQPTGPLVGGGCNHLFPHRYIFSRIFNQYYSFLNRSN